MRKPDQVTKRPEGRESGAVDLDAVREVRAAADVALEQHRAAVERDLILHEALFSAVHQAALEGFLGHEERQADETATVADMWARRWQEHLESPEHRAAA